ncbi:MULTISPECIES: ribosome silencing factor [Myxococcus]|uniref:ribosome silencing factor n=1 Tax=Myxococcus TaxID=32 RepID=UPI0002FC3612|nr:MULTISPECIES: ribosome silencing factor [Myxococcus]QZZ48769.1 Ribosomal silencing factor RsfS [Myxococcus xanthus]UYI15882.1 ribosome silencing factor [Myxococcus xanthus]UYI23245.1 ribosome silencing factor [Myxococcus xanthus]SDW41921.1 ribosome-associated protein [Myxococcus xanthus]
MATKKKTTAKKTTTRAPAARKKTVSGKTPAKKKVPAAKKSAAKAPAKAAAKAPAKKKKAKLPVAPPQKVGPAENPAAKALAHRIGNLLVDKKAQDVVILDVRGMTSYADYFVIASAETDRQVSAMAENVQVQLKTGDEPMRPIGTEGFETGQWVLLDYGEVVAHLFLTDLRAHYDLEGLWADASREKLA